MFEIPDLRRVRTTFRPPPDDARASASSLAPVRPGCHLVSGDSVRPRPRVGRDGGGVALEEIHHVRPAVARPVSSGLDPCDVGTPQQALPPRFVDERRARRLDR